MSTSLENALQKTPLYENHQKRGAKIVDFAGWAMPLQFGKVLEEHQAVRNACGVFDISHMGLVLVQTPSIEASTSFLDQLVPQDLNKLIPGKAVYTQFLNEQGGILDDIIIYQLPSNLDQATWKGFTTYLVICNASNTPADIDWMKAHNQANASISFASDRYCLFALQGPQFENTLKAFNSYKPDALPKRFHIAENSLDGIPVLLARTGYTGEDGVEVIVPIEKAETLWNGLLEKGAIPIGLAARDTLRLEAAYPLHGHDISPTTSPLEAGLGWSVKLNKPGNFIGKAALEKQLQTGLPKKAYCIKIKKKTIAREHDILQRDGKTIGEVTSGSISPLTNEAIAMVYIDGGLNLQPGDTVQVVIRNQPVDAEVVERPFYKRNA